MSIDRSDLFEGPLAPRAELRHAWMDPTTIAERQARADRLLAAEGAGHLVHDLPVRSGGRAASVQSRPWRLDPIPVVLDERVFGWLAAIMSERMRALNAVIADLYGPRTLVRDGVVPAAALASTDRYRLSAVGARPPRWLSTYAVDVMVDASGVWSLVQDLTDAPPGLGYALLDRSVMSRVSPQLLAESGVASLSAYSSVLRRALARSSPEESPRIVLFSGGLDHPSYIDHSYLAVRLGVNLVEGADLVVRQRRVWLRTLDGLEPVDVLYRRLEDPTVDPLEVGARGSAGVPGLLQAVRAGGVGLVNAHGSGVVESPLVQPFVDDAIARLSPTRATLPAFRGVVGSPSRVPIAPGLSGPEGGDAGVVVRLFAVDDGDRVTVLPGGSGRVVLPGDDPRTPTACIAKDVWVQGQSYVVPPHSADRLPQLDLKGSVPTRAADALYWTNRAAERAEAMSRTIRVIATRLEQQPDLADWADGEWARRLLFLATSSRRASPADADLVAGGGTVALRRELAALGDAVATEIGSLLTEAITVREFLSGTTGRILAHLADIRSSLQGQSAVADDADNLLADFAALAGLWSESTVGGPAWIIGDSGRRLERSLVVLDLVDAAFGPIWARGATELDEADEMTIEVLLAANDSLVAYRRRHRSEVEAEAALGLLVRDATNPRSLAACLHRLRDHAAEIGWSAGGDVFVTAIGALELDGPEMSRTVRSTVWEAERLLVQRWFSAPVSPILMHPVGIEEGADG